MGQFSPKAQRMALEAIVGGRLEVGLFRGEVEVDDPDYERQPIQAGDGRDRSGARIMTNTAEVLFPAFSQSTQALASMPPIDNFRVFDSEGDEVSRSEITPRKPQRTDRFVIRPGTVVFGIR